MVGCGGVVPASPGDKPNQAEAVALVWFDVYEMTVEPPAIKWIEGDALDCPGGESWVVGEQGCAFEFFSIDYRVSIAWPKGGARLADLPFAHGLCHAKVWLETADWDAGHLGPCFTYPSLSGSGQIALTAAGL
jgi:hypothetical protein